ncbi:hypothetical protein D3C73_589180 [compost metagenome]
MILCIRSTKLRRRSLDTGIFCRQIMGQAHMYADPGRRIREIRYKAAAYEAFLLERGDAADLVTLEPVQLPSASGPQKIAVIREISESVIPVAKPLRTRSILPEALQIEVHAAFRLVQNPAQLSRVIQGQHSRCPDRSCTDSRPVMCDGLPVIRAVFQKRPEYPAFHFSRDPGTQQRRQPPAQK